MALTEADFERMEGRFRVPEDEDALVAEVRRLWETGVSDAIALTMANDTAAFHEAEAEQARKTTLTEIATMLDGEAEAVVSDEDGGKSWRRAAKFFAQRVRDGWLK